MINKKLLLIVVLISREVYCCDILKLFFGIRNTIFDEGYYSDRSEEISSTSSKISPFSDALSPSFINNFSENTYRYNSNEDIDKNLNDSSPKLYLDSNKFELSSERKNILKKLYIVTCTNLLNNYLDINKIDFEKNKKILKIVKNCEILQSSIDNNYNSQEFIEMDSLTYKDRIEKAAFDLASIGCIDFIKQKIEYLDGLSDFFEKNSNNSSEVSNKAIRRIAKVRKIFKAYEKLIK